MKREVLTTASCRSCGACCTSMNDEGYWADVEAADEKRLGKRFVRLHVIQRFSGAAIKTHWRRQRAGPHEGYEFDVCVALRGSVMKQVSCSVYERRPRVCRVAVKPGDRSCREIRKAMQEKVEELDGS